MQLYLPIADVPVNIFLILAMGGGRSDSCPACSHWRRLPDDAAIDLHRHHAGGSRVASVASHIAASSFSGAISYWRRRAIDPLLALVLLAGGMIGTALGVWTFTQLRLLGQLDLMIALSYVALLTTVGALMFWEGLRAMLRLRRGVTVSLRRSGKP